MMFMELLDLINSKCTRSEVLQRFPFDIYCKFQQLCNASEIPRNSSKAVDSETSALYKVNQQGFFVISICKRTAHSTSFFFFCKDKLEKGVIALITVA